MTATPAPKPIETRYAGCRFRSRLEARWAIFFDRLGVKWEYEAQGYVVGGRPYLPDFVISPGPQMLVEVKGDLAELDYSLINTTVRTLGLPMLILGPVPRPGSRAYVHQLVGQSCVMGWAWPYADTQVADALDAARSARFEHGETPTPPIRPTTGQDDGFRPTVLMEKVSKYLENARQPRSGSQICRAIKARRSVIHTAIECLSSEGYIGTTSGPRGTILHHIVAIYRQEVDRHDQPNWTAQTEREYQAWIAQIEGGG